MANPSARAGAGTAAMTRARLAAPPRIRRCLPIRPSFRMGDILRRLPPGSSEPQRQARRGAPEVEVPEADVDVVVDLVVAQVAEVAEVGPQGQVVAHAAQDAHAGVDAEV